MYNKDVRTETTANEAETKVVSPVAIFTSAPVEVEEFVDSVPAVSEPILPPVATLLAISPLQSAPCRPSSTSRRRAIIRRRPHHTNVHNTITITHVLGTAESKDCASRFDVDVEEIVGAEAYKVLESEVVKESVGAEADKANVVDLQCIARARRNRSLRRAWRQSK